VSVGWQVTEVASEKELIVELARGTSGDAEESGELLVAAASAAFGNVGWQIYRSDEGGTPVRRDGAPGSATVKAVPSPGALA